MSDGKGLLDPVVLLPGTCKDNTRETEICVMRVVALLGAAACLLACCSPLASMKKSLRRCFSATSVQNDLSFLSASLPGFLHASSRTRKTPVGDFSMRSMQPCLSEGRVGEVRWEGVDGEREDR